MGSLFGWPAVLALLAQMAGPATITTEGRTRPVQAARFGIEVRSEVVHSSVLYALDVAVDEHSGDDGALAPCAQTIPVQRAAGGRHPSLQALSTLTVSEGDCEEWDAWFGNDAPELCGNVMRFQGWQAGSLRIHWEARYQGRDGTRPFAFDGPAEFTGIYVAVPRGEDPDAHLARVWGGQPAKTLDRHRLGDRDYGPDFPPERRYSEFSVYTPKGMPLSRHWDDRKTRAPR